MDIAEIKSKMTEFFGKDDMYRMPLGVAVEDWLVAEHDRLSADLTSAKEEIERLKYWDQFVCGRCHGVGEITVTSGQTPESFSQENVPCPDCVGPIIDRAESAESSLASERKETERLKGFMRDALNPTTLGVSHLDIEDCKCWNCCQKRLQTALQERQGEE